MPLCGHRAFSHYNDEPGLHESSIAFFFVFAAEPASRRHQPSYAAPPLNALASQAAE